MEPRRDEQAAPVGPPTLGDVGERRELRIRGMTFVGHRRRPSGEPPPLPRPLRLSGWLWLGAGILVIAVWSSLFLWQGTADWWTERDYSVIRWVAETRRDSLTDVMNAVDALRSEWFLRILRLATLLTLVWFKRWRHLMAGLLVLLLVAQVGSVMTDAIGRVRPPVYLLTSWEGYSHPSVPVAALTVTLVVIGYTLLPRGPWRLRWFVLTAVLVSLLVVARVYLGVDHPTDGIFGVFYPVAITVVGFRLLVPETVFPLSYGRSRTAHLDVDGERGRAIRQALRDRFGVEVVAIEPFGQEGSGGSTPLRLTVAGEPDTHLFAKLYSKVHLRSDRWYKVGREILYGALEDEVRFESVQRLVQYEDYLLRVMRDARVPSAAPLGIAEITPGREYLLVTEFLEGAVEIRDATVDDAVIDEALLTIRRLWDAGLAHRDIKPSNVLVRGRKVVLIDVAFATAQPTPWRQAVDLANMMLILALHTGPERVYQRALQFFAPEDVAEAFAATRGITIPSQSREAIRGRQAEEQRDLVSEFKALAPPREPIRVQRWSLRRLTLSAVTLGVLALLAAVILDNARGEGFL